GRMTISKWVKYIGQNRSSVPNEWRLRSRRKFFRPYIRTIFKLMKHASERNPFIIKNSILLNPIHTDSHIGELLNIGKYKICLRYLYFVEGAFEDPRFDWFRVATSERIGKYEFLISLKILKSTKDRLK